MMRRMHWLAETTALAGGLVLCLLILMTSISITGRALIIVGLGPVPGDYEVLEAGIAFAIFCFMPLCQLQATHATVDLFTSGLGPRLNRALLALWEVMLTAALALLAWRLAAGMLGKFENGETTMFLQFSVWWAYAACLPPAIIGVVIGMWSAFDRVRALITGHDTRPIFAGAMH